MSLTTNLSPEQKVTLISENIGEIKQELITFIKVSRVSPDVALIVARRIVEFLVNGTLERESFECTDVLIENIATLGDKGDKSAIKRRGESEPVLPPTINSTLHSLRISGNSVVHPFEKGTTIRKGVIVSQTDIDITLLQLLRIVEWFFVEYSKGPKIIKLYTENTIDSDMLNKYLHTKGFRRVVREHVVVDGMEELQETNLVLDVRATELAFSDKFEDEEFEDEDEDETLLKSEDWSVISGNSFDFHQEKVRRQGLLTTLRTEVPRMVIIAPLGSGKSTSLRYLVYLDACRYLEDPHHSKFPIYVELKFYTPGKSLENLISHAMPLGDRLRPMLQQGAIALYLDGLNEVIDPNQFTHLVNEIKILLETYSSIDFFITCRPQGYRNNFSLPTFKINTFSDSQIYEYLQKNYGTPQESAGFYSSLQKNAKLKKLCETPFILWMLLAVTNKGKLIPNNTGDLVHRFMEALLEREVSKDASFDKQCTFHINLSSLAYATRSINMSIFSELDAVKLLGYDRIDLHMFINLACNMNVLEKSSENQFTFVHELYQEYYAAVRLAEMASQDENLIETWINDPRWVESVILCAGIIKNRELFIRLIAAKNPLRAAQCITSSTRQEKEIEAEVLGYSKAAARSKNREKATEGILALIEMGAVSEALICIRRKTSSTKLGQLLNGLVDSASSSQLQLLLGEISGEEDKITDKLLHIISIRTAENDSLFQDIFYEYYDKWPMYCPVMLQKPERCLRIDIESLFEKILLIPGDNAYCYILLIYNNSSLLKVKYPPEVLTKMFLTHGGEQSLLKALDLIDQYNIYSQFPIEHIVQCFVDNGGEQTLLRAADLIALHGLEYLFPIDQLVKQLLNCNGEQSFILAADLIGQHNLQKLFSVEQYAQMVLNRGEQGFLKAINLIGLHKINNIFPLVQVIEHLLDFNSVKSLQMASNLLERVDHNELFQVEQVVQRLWERDSSNTILRAVNLISKYNLFTIYPLGMVMQRLWSCNEEKALLKTIDLIDSHNFRSQIFPIEQVIERLFVYRSEQTLLKALTLIEQSNLQTVFPLDRIVQQLLDCSSDHTLIKAANLIIQHNLITVFSIEDVAQKLLDHGGGNTLIKAIELINQYNIFGNFPVEQVVQRLLDHGDGNTLIKATNLIILNNLHYQFPINHVVQRLLDCNIDHAISKAIRLIKVSDLQSTEILKQVVERMLLNSGAENSLLEAVNLISQHNLYDQFAPDYIVKILLAYNSEQSILTAIDIIELHNLQILFSISSVIDCLLSNGGENALNKVPELIEKYNVKVLFPLRTLLQKMLWVMVSGQVCCYENGNLRIDLCGCKALLLADNLIKNEAFNVGDSIRAVVSTIAMTINGPEIILSRTHPKFLTKLLEAEVPEIKNGLVKIISVARNPGFYAKIAVISLNHKIDPVKVFTGNKRSHIKKIELELGGEKIGVIPWSDDKEHFICNALAPAKVSIISFDEEHNSYSVTVHDGQIGLAYGNKRQNWWLATKLTGARIYIKS